MKIIQCYNFLSSFWDILNYLLVDKIVYHSKIRYVFQAINHDQPNSAMLIENPNFHYKSFDNSGCVFLLITLVLENNSIVARVTVSTKKKGHNYNEWIPARCRLYQISTIQSFRKLPHLLLLPLYTDTDKGDLFFLPI